MDRINRNRDIAYYLKFIKDFQAVEKIESLDNKFVFLFRYSDYKTLDHAEVFKEAKFISICSSIDEKEKKNELIWAWFDVAGRNDFSRSSKIKKFTVWAFKNPVPFTLPILYTNFLLQFCSNQRLVVTYGEYPAKYVQQAHFYLEDIVNHDFPLTDIGDCHWLHFLQRSKKTTKITN